MSYKSKRRSGQKDKRVADESVIVKMVRTTQPDRSEGTLLYLKSFFGGEVGKTDKNFHKTTGTEGKDIQQGEDRSTLGRPVDMPC